VQAGSHGVNHAIFLVGFRGQCMRISGDGFPGTVYNGGELSISRSSGVVGFARRGGSCAGAGSVSIRV
jgi:hypothetical protein